MTTISYQGNITRFSTGAPLDLFGPLHLGDQVMVSWTGTDCDCSGSNSIFPVTDATITINHVTLDLFARGGVGNNEWLGTGDSQFIQVQSLAGFLTTTNDGRGVFLETLYGEAVFFSTSEVNRVPGPEAGSGVLGLLVLGLLLATWWKREALA